MMKQPKHLVLIAISTLVVWFLFQLLVVMPTARQARLIVAHDTFQKNMEALKRDPNDATAHRKLGYRYLAQRDLRRSELHWRGGVRIEQENREARFWLPNILQRNKEIMKPGSFISKL